MNASLLGVVAGNTHDSTVGEGWRCEHPNQHRSGWQCYRSAARLLDGYVEPDAVALVDAPDDPRVVYLGEQPPEGKQRAYAFTLRATWADMQALDKMYPGGCLDCGMPAVEGRHTNPCREGDDCGGPAAHHAFNPGAHAAPALTGPGALGAHL